MIAIETAAPPSLAFDFVADPRNEVKWNPRALRVEQLSDQPLSVDSAFRVFGRMMAREVAVDVHIVELDPPGRTQTRASSGPVRFETTYVIKPCGSGASVTMSVRVTAQGPLRLVAPVLQAAFRRRTAPMAARLKMAIDDFPAAESEGGR